MRQVYKFCLTCHKKAARGLTRSKLGKELVVWQKYTDTESPAMTSKLIRRPDNLNCTGQLLLLMPVSTRRLFLHCGGERASTPLCQRSSLALQSWQRGPAMIFVTTLQSNHLRPFKSYSLHNSSLKSVTIFMKMCCGTRPATFQAPKTRHMPSLEIR